MADKRIDQLDAADALAGTEPVPVYQGGTTKRATAAQIAALASAGVTVSGTAPDSPANGALWFDTSGSIDVLKVWVSGSPGSWVSVNTAETNTYDNTASGLAAADVQAAIDELSGASVLPFSLQDYIDSLAFNGGGRLFGTQDWIYTNNGYTLQGFGTTTGASYSGALRTAGKLYFEVLLNSRVATMQIGVSQRLAAVSVRVGLNTATGSNLASWSLDASGFKYHGSGTNISLPSVTDDVIQVAVDFATGKIWFGVNNTFSGDPVAGTGEAYSSITGAIRPGISPDGGTATLRLKLADFDFSPPTGFSPWSAP